MSPQVAKVRVLIRAALTTTWSSEAWSEAREHLLVLFTQGRRLRRQGVAELTRRIG